MEQKGKFPKGKKYGFIAQELEKILPEVVIKGSDGYYGINYDEITPVLATAIKEQQKIIENQNTKIKDIEKELALLKEMIASLNTSKKVNSATDDKAELIIK